MRKKIVSFVLCIAVAVTFMPTMALEANALSTGSAYDYSATKALNYAKAHWNDSQLNLKDSDGNLTDEQDCVIFTKACAEEGGIPVDTARNYGYSVPQYVDYMVDNGYAKLNKLTIKSSPLSTGTANVLNYNDNKGKVSEGDILLYKCPTCGQYFHVAVCAGFGESLFQKDGYATCYARNVEVNNGLVVGLAHGEGTQDGCKNNLDTEIYALRILSESNGFSSYAGQVTGLKSGTMGSKSVKLTWNKLSGATKYRVFRSNKQYGVYQKVGDTTGTSMVVQTKGPSAVDPLKTIKYYYYIVKPVKTTSSGTAYVGANAMVKARMAAPTSVTAKALKNNFVRVTWKAVPQATYYELYKATSLNGKYTRVKVTKELYFDNGGLTQGKKYYYKVRAYGFNADGQSYFSGYSAKTSAYSGGMVVGLKAVRYSRTSLKISWYKSDCATKYRVMRARTKSATVGTCIGTTTKTSFIAKGLTKGKTYYFYVVPYNGTQRGYNGKTIAARTY